MIKTAEFYNELLDNGISFFSGVPDSLLKDICGYITDHTDKQKNIIAANEGAAVALAAGHFLATGNPGVVYMQNSGQGNVINPLLSLTDPDVYSIPMLLMIGWRGEPGVKDEPQHVKQGKVTLGLLDTIGVPYEIVPDTIEEAKKSIAKAVKIMKETNNPYALIIRKGLFEKYSLQKKEVTNHPLVREDAIKIIIDQLDASDAIVSTTGKTSREVFEYREALSQGHGNDFLTVGSMGHASQIALGVALANDKRQVFCLDGDGAAIMHMGSMAICGLSEASNFKHIIINNGAHDSVGGQPTVGFEINFPLAAEACRYKAVFQAETSEEIKEAVSQLRATSGPALLEIKVNKGARDELGRPTTTPIQNKESFMQFLRS